VGGWVGGWVVLVAAVARLLAIVAPNLRLRAQRAAVLVPDRHPATRHARNVARWSEMYLSQPPRHSYLPPHQEITAGCASRCRFDPAGAACMRASLGAELGREGVLTAPPAAPSRAGAASAGPRRCEPRRTRAHPGGGAVGHTRSVRERVRASWAMMGRHT
jgi:hypothetical protein